MDETVTEVLVACISAIAVIVAAIITARGHKKPEGNTFNNKGSVSAPIVQGNGTVGDIIQGNTIEVKTMQVIHTQGESKEKPDAEPDAHVIPPCMPRSLGKIRLRGARRPRKNGIM